ncbi:MAG: 2-dehydropantoate 2-reductase N-terminal domain-containing protein [Pseudomonadota bacterium]
MSLDFVIYGAGGIGGVIGAKLQLDGYPTTFIARGDHGDAMRSSGLRLITPTRSHQLSVDVAFHPTEIGFSKNSVVLMCMKSQHMLAALEDLSRCPGSEAATIVCAQNGVANEDLALRYFPNVLGCVVNLPAMFLTPGEVVSYASSPDRETLPQISGILDVGVIGSATARQEDVTKAVSDALGSCGFSSQVQPAIMRWKYAKLLLNLLNILQACLSDFDNSLPLRRLIRREALDCFAAAEIDCATKEQGQARATTDSGKPLYVMQDVQGFERTAGSSWQSLRRGTGDIETEYLNGEICRLGRLHGIATPANDACVQMARQTINQNLGPGAFSAAQLLAMLGSN